MKKVTLLVIFALCLALAGCSKDADIDAFISEFESITKDLVARIDADPSAAGLDEAQKSFDGKKASLRSKWDAIKGAVGFQVSADAKKKLEDSVKKNMKDLMDVSMKHAATIASDNEAEAKFTKLLRDYQATFEAPK